MKVREGSEVNEGEGSIGAHGPLPSQSIPLSIIGHPNIAGVLLSVVRVASHIPPRN
jgi:hypothetical protein